ncbi:hypothetical protein HS090_27420 (plasmid) [Klebsiella pneumoniae]|uniref:hypothetical protein n=1 Tax=Klebsiella pneumoniae TaxID=573 RepID=UPI001602BA8D|nr:hypothetical protein [Klebsiella pneumoniae]QNB37406.1 hypothetical protein HS090_27420 [Klebsiella pneumoniae]
MKSLTVVQKALIIPLSSKSKWSNSRIDKRSRSATRRGEHGINDNLLNSWRWYWREGKLRPPFYNRKQRA